MSDENGRGRCYNGGNHDDDEEMRSYEKKTEEENYINKWNSGCQFKSQDLDARFFAFFKYLLSAFEWVWASLPIYMPDRYYNIVHDKLCIYNKSLPTK